MLVNSLFIGSMIVKPTDLWVQTRQREILSQDDGAVCPNLVEEISCPAPT